MISPAQKIPNAEACAIARDIVDVLKPHCEKLIVAGSLRRRKPFVSDIEILFIPSFKRAPDPNDLLGVIRAVNQAELAIADLLKVGAIAKRLNVRGIETWGALNKHAIHAPTGAAVDLFTATRENWFNQVVCRTGSAESNIAVAAAAKSRGWYWHPYGEGFTRGRSDFHRTESEADVFNFVGLPFLDPWKR